MPSCFCTIFLTTILLTFGTGIPFAFSGEAIKTVIWKTPDDWEGLVSKAGQGLYVDIVESVFHAYDITVQRQTVPWKRALYSVMIGRGDFTGGQSPSSTYYNSTRPLFQGWEYIFFRRGTLSGPTVLDQLQNKQGVWTMGYVDGLPASIKKYIQGKDVGDRQQALKMVLTGRADYYLDNRVQMNQTLDSTVYPVKDFQCEEFFSAKVHMIFTKNDRGRTIRDLYDKQIEVLAKSGELKKIYDKWHFSLPDDPSKGSKDKNFPPPPLAKNTACQDL